MRQREYLIVVLISVLMVGCDGAKNAGTGDAVRENFAEAAKSPDAKTLPANHEVFDPGTEPAVPSRPTTGTRKQALSQLRRHCAFVHVISPSFPAHSMASLKALSVRHRTQTPLSAPATSSKLSTTRSRSQTGWAQCCVVARSLCSAF